MLSSVAFVYQTFQVAYTTDWLAECSFSNVSKIYYKAHIARPSHRIGYTVLRSSSKSSVLCSAPSTFQFSWIPIQDNVICFHCYFSVSSGFFFACVPASNCVAADAAGAVWNERSQSKSLSASAPALLLHAIQFYFDLSSCYLSRSCCSHTHTPRRYYSAGFCWFVYAAKLTLLSIYCATRMNVSASVASRIEKTHSTYPTDWLSKAPALYTSLPHWITHSDIMHELFRRSLHADDLFFRIYFCSGEKSCKINLGSAFAVV